MVDFELERRLAGDPGRQLRVMRLGECEIEAAMPALGLRQFPGLAQPLPCVLPDRFQQSILRLVAVAFHQDERLVDEPAEQIQHGCGVDVLGAHLLHRGQGEAAGEYREPTKEQSLLGVEQLVTPLQCGEQRLLPSHRMPAALPEEAERVVEPLGDLSRCQHAYPRGREFQGQGHPVETEADLCDGGRIVRVQLETRDGLRGPLHEQPHG